MGFVGTFFFCVLILSHKVTELPVIILSYLPFSQIHVAGFQMLSFLHTLCFFKFLHPHQHLSLFHFSFELHCLPSNLHSHLHDICFVNIFNSFAPVIMLKTFRFKSPVLSGTHALLDK